MTSVHDYQTGEMLDGGASKELAQASRDERNGTGAVAAVWDGKLWQLCRNDWARSGVRTVYVMD